MKQHYKRTYEHGRETRGWDRGERITNVKQVKPGDVLIAVSSQFQAENLVRVLERECTIGDGFEYEYVDCETLRRSDGGRMFCHSFEIGLGHSEYYRAIGRRPSRRIPKSKLPSWLSYQEH